MKKMNLGKKRYELTYHYLDNPSKTYNTVQICHSFIDAVNLTLCDVRWHPIVFDTWVEEDFNDVGDVAIKKANKSKKTS